MDDNNDNKGASSGDNPDGRQSQDNIEGKNPPEWKAIAGDKFKSEADLAKAYKELEKKLGVSSEEVRKSKEFTELMTPLLEEIRKDPEIFNTLDKRLRTKENPESKEETRTADPEVRSVASELVLGKFEEKYGIDKLTPDERKEVRRKVGDVIFDLTGTTLDRVDLRRLGNVLENAYVLANKDKLIEKSKLEALASARESDGAAISSLHSSEGKGEPTLTPEETRTAERLGLTREQYLEGKKVPAKGKR